MRTAEASLAAAMGTLAPFVIRQARHALRNALLHELDENIRVDGVLAFDPHPGAAR